MNFEKQLLLGRTEFRTTMILKIHRPPAPLTGHIRLSGSKSISNRVLAIRALCHESFDIQGLAEANDTQLMLNLLTSGEDLLDAGPAGTTFRFLTALLSLREGTQILTGSERMKQRPIGVLVEVLRTLGADIAYLENEGFPPLRIGPPRDLGRMNELSISAGTSSQYISALLLIAPALPEGLVLHLEGAIVSRPYIEMTLRLMQHFGVEHSWEEQTIRVAAQSYQARPFRVEADWSAASYYYAMAALAPEAELTLDGLFADSLQGDAVLVEMMRPFGVQTTFSEHAAHLKKVAGAAAAPVFEWDFIQCPDLAQTLAVVCGGLGVHGVFSGLETLRIKETDRIAALKTELGKTGVMLHELPRRMAKRSDKQFFLLEGKCEFTDMPVFDTYEDHRMAMAFAPLGMLSPVAVREPAVVHKSYPAFWEDIATLGFDCQSLTNT